MAERWCCLALSELFSDPRCVLWRVWVLYNIIVVWGRGATARVVAVVIRMRIRWLTVWQIGTGGTLSAVSILEVLLRRVVEASWLVFKPASVIQVLT